MARPGRFTLVFVPHNQANVKQLSGPFLLCCCILLIGLFAFGIWSIGATTVVSIFDGGKLSDLEHENNTLSSRLQELNVLMGSLKNQMEDLVEREQEARLIVGLPETEADSLGAAEKNTIDPFGLLENTKSPTAVASTIQKNLDVLLQDINQETASLQDIQKKANKDQEYWRHVPIVRPVDGPTSSQFGMRQDPFTGLRRMHPGFDIAARRGEPVRATADGMILRAGKDVNYGNYVEIDHGNGYVTLYGHLSIIKAKQGKEITRGDIIGNVGKTGRAAGYHLHYEVRLQGQAVDPKTHFFPVESTSK